MGFSIHYFLLLEAKIDSHGSPCSKIPGLGDSVNVIRLFIGVISVACKVHNIHFSHGTKMRQKLILSAAK